MQPASRRVCRFYNIIVGEPGVAEQKKASGRAIAAPHFSLQGFGYSGESIEIRACARDLKSNADPENAYDSADRGNLAKPIRVRFT
jgi:hypothetical protein